jgi:hypothetical protein
VVWAEWVVWVAWECKLKNPTQKFKIPKKINTSWGFFFVLISMKSQ